MSTSKITNLEHLKKLAQRTQAEVAAVDAKVGAIKQPTKVSELTNDSGYQTEEQVSAAISTAISKTGHAVYQTAESVPAVGDAQENVLYLVMNAKTKHYDIYAKVGEEVVLLDDTTVDLSGYDTAEQAAVKLSGKVDKEDGKGLSTNDFTDEDKAKLDEMGYATDDEVDAMLTEVFGETA